uniref:Hexosyltransferase n=1 Tax=Kalanchoe fedtschenkoi TaxID=63787 RepID=A0A7N0TG65_KALFE
MSICTKTSTMGSKKYSVHHHKFQQPPIFFLFFVSFIIFILTLSSYKQPKLGGAADDDDDQHHQGSDISPNVSEVGRLNRKRAEWVDAVVEELGIIKKRIVRMGLVNMEDEEGFMLEEREEDDSSGGGSSLETVGIKFDRVREGMKWEELYPEWIDEEVKFGVPPSCPDIPLAVEESSNNKVDVLVARGPCGVRDVFRLQVNLVVADLAVRNGGGELKDTAVLVVFIGECGPMMEVFTCDDLLREGDGFWIYKPNLNKLRQKMEMPIGSCQLAPGDMRVKALAIQKPREAYVTLLHSSEAYVCGAIALAQSIKLTNSTKDLILLADASITSSSMCGLRAAGWKIKVIRRIRSPWARKGDYNEWNYSKLRVWQLTEYDKVIFIDSDLVVVRNIDHFFQHRQLSAAGNDGMLFNSGVMLIEPSDCMFKTLMKKTPVLVSYNGGDQGFLNEVFTWWHRWPAKINALKNYADGDELRQVPNGTFAIHYLGLKPWMCYRDYDCNWDMDNHHVFASDMAHARWWEIYDTMLEDLRPYCALTTKMDERIRKWRNIAGRADAHWSIKPTDPRRKNANR